MNDIRIEIVPDSPCPGCGAYWGHPDPKLDFPNRIKVDDHWRCYNPDCIVGYYDADGTVVERKPSPAEAERIAARSKARVDAMMASSRWVSQVIEPGHSVSQVIPADAPLPDGWSEGLGAL